MLSMKATSHPLGGLPDPARQAEFYNQVPALRLIAFFIDTAIILILTLICPILSLFTLSWIMPFLSFAISVGYRMIALQTHSATLGMKWMGIELREGTGHPVTRQTALFHSAVFSAMFIIPFIPVINMVIMLVTPYGQGLHDMPFGTTAIRRP